MGDIAEMRMQADILEQLAWRICVAYARNGGNNFRDHCEAEAAVQWMAEALKENGLTDTADEVTGRHHPFAFYDTDTKQFFWLNDETGAPEPCSGIVNLYTQPGVGVIGRLYRHPDSGDPNDWIVTPDEDCHAADATYERVRILPATNASQPEAREHE